MWSAAPQVPSCGPIRGHRGHISASGGIAALMRVGGPPRPAESPPWGPQSTPAPPVPDHAGRAGFMHGRGGHRCPTGCNKRRKPRRRRLCTGAAEYGHSFQARAKRAQCRGARPRGGRRGIPPPLATCGNKRERYGLAHAAAWNVPRTRERPRTPSKDLPFTPWTVPNLRDPARVGTVWHGPHAGTVLIHRRTAPRRAQSSAPTPPKTPPPPRGRAPPPCARKR